MNRMLSIILFVTLVFTHTALASNFWRQTWEEFKSPITTSAVYTLAGGTSFSTFFFMQDTWQAQLLDYSATNKPLGRWSRVGDLSGQLIPNIAYVGAFYGLSFLIKDSQRYRMKHRALHMFKATFYSALVTTILKHTVREPRPNDPNNKLSFPSGHTTTAFAFAATVGAQHRWYWSVPAYALATLVGYSRINDNQHRLHNVIAGATIGMVYGIGLSKLSKRQKEMAKGIALIPLTDGGLSLSYHGRF